MALISSDTFTVGADTTLASRVPDIGTGWTREFGTSGTMSALTASGEAASIVNITSGNQAYTCQPNPTTPDYDIGCYVALAAPGSDDPVWFIARLTDANNYYVAGTYQQGSTADKKMVKNVAATKTEIATGDSNVIGSDTFVFELRGTALQLYQAGVVKLSIADSAISVAGRAGFGVGNLGTITTDDVHVSEHFDNFSVTEAGAAATTSMLQMPSPSMMHMLVR